MSRGRHQAVFSRQKRRTSELFSDKCANFKNERRQILALFLKPKKTYLFYRSCAVKCHRCKIMYASRNAVSYFQYVRKNNSEFQTKQVMF